MSTPTPQELDSLQRQVTEHAAERDRAAGALRRQSTDVMRLRIAHAQGVADEQDLREAEAVEAEARRQYDRAAADLAAAQELFRNAADRYEAAAGQGTLAFT